MKTNILSLDRFANAKLFRLSYTVHRDYTFFRKPVQCRYKIYTIALIIVILCASMVSHAQTPHKVCIYIGETCQSQCEDQITICFTIIVGESGPDCEIINECVSFTTKTTYCFFLDACEESLPANIYISVWTKDSSSNRCCCGILESTLNNWTGNPEFNLELENCE